MATIGLLPNEPKVIGPSVTAATAGTTSTPGGVANPTQTPIPQTTPTQALNASSLSQQQYQTIHAAVTDAFSGVERGVSNATIDQKILADLQASGQFTTDELNTIYTGVLHIPGATNPSGIEQANRQGYKGGDSGAALMNQWQQAIFANLSAFFASQPATLPAPITTPPNTPSGPGNAQGQSGGLGVDVGAGGAQQAASGLLSGSGGGVPGSGSIGGALPVPVTNTTSGPNTTVVLIIIAAALALLGWYLWKKHKRKEEGAAA